MANINTYREPCCQWQHRKHTANLQWFVQRLFYKGQFSSTNIVGTSITLTHISNCVPPKRATADRAPSPSHLHILAFERTTAMQSYMMGRLIWIFIFCGCQKKKPVHIIIAPSLSELLWSCGALSSSFARSASVDGRAYGNFLKEDGESLEGISDVMGTVWSKNFCCRIIIISIA